MNQSRVALTYFESFESFREEILNTHKNKKDELSALPYQRININNTYRINTRGVRTAIHALSARAERARILSVRAERAETSLSASQCAQRAQAW